MLQATAMTGFRLWNLDGLYAAKTSRYVNADRSRTRKIVGHAAERGVKAIFITVDAPQLGRREKVSSVLLFRLQADKNQDMRTKFEGAASAHQMQGKDTVRRDQGAARAISSFIDPSLNWADLKELKDVAKGMKVILKGVQTWEVRRITSLRGKLLIVSSGRCLGG